MRRNFHSLLSMTNTLTVGLHDPAKVSPRRRAWITVQSR